MKESECKHKHIIIDAYSVAELPDEYISRKGYVIPRHAVCKHCGYAKVILEAYEYLLSWKSPKLPYDELE